MNVDDDVRMQQGGRRENERGDAEREGESGGTVEVTENREINRQPIPPFTSRVSFIGSDNRKSVTRN